MRVEPRLLVAVAVLSASVLAYEVLLTRLLSVVHWHHFTSLVVGLALLGFAASGTALALGAWRRLAPADGWFAALAALYAVAAPACFGVAERVPFNAMEVAWDLRQGAWLTALYLVLAVPFFLAGMAIGLLLVRCGRAAGTLYAADLAGAGVGSAGVLGLLLVLAPERALDPVAGLGAVAAALAPGVGSRRRALASGGLLALAAALAAGAFSAWSALEISEFKGLAQALRANGATVVALRSGPWSTAHAVENPVAPLRSAPGLSIVSPVSPPEQIAVFRDGDAPTAVNRRRAGAPPPAYLDWLTSAAAYHLVARPRVAVLGAGGGSGVLQALLHDARAVDAVEVDGGVGALLGGPLAGYAGGLLADPAVAWHRREARGFVQRRPGAYDLVLFEAPDAPGASAAGAFSLRTSPLLTVEGMGVALRALRPGGLLSVTTWNHLPPRTSLRVLATAIEALERAGNRAPGASLAWLRGWSTATLLVKNGRLSAGEVEAFRRFASERQFDLAWYPGMRREEANRFNLLARPHLHDAARALLGPRAGAFLADYKLDVAPVPDTRPYAYSFFRWRHLPEVLRLRAQGGVGLLDVGVLVLLATLVAAVLAALLLVALPARLAGRRSARRGGIRVAGYFAGIGFGFIFVEIAVVHVLVQVFHHPVYALSAVLGGFLLLAGAGSALLARLGPAASAVLPAIVTLAAAAGLALPLSLGPLEGLGTPVRAALVLVAVGPLAVLMGMPFPAAVARLAAAGRDADVAWGWAVNGCGSVIGAAAAALLAREWGYPALLFAGALAYLVAALSQGRGARASA